MRTLKFWTAQSDYDVWPEENTETEQESQHRQRQALKELLSHANTEFDSAEGD